MHFISLQDLIFSQMFSYLFQGLHEVLMCACVIFPPCLCFPFASPENCKHSPGQSNILPTREKRWQLPSGGELITPESELCLAMDSEVNDCQKLLWLNEISTGSFKACDYSNWMLSLLKVYVRYGAVVLTWENFLPTGLWIN